MTKESNAPILTSDSLYVISENDPISLVPDSDSVSVFQENDSVKFDNTTLVISKNIEPKGEIRRYSTGYIAIPYTRVRILSRYLAASTSSCHDYCKYGRKQALETQGRSPMLKRARHECQNVEKDTTLLEREKKLAVNCTPSSVSRSQMANIHVVMKKDISSSKKEFFLSQKLSLPLKRIGVSANTPGYTYLKAAQSKQSIFPKEEYPIGKSKVMRSSQTSSHGASGSRGKIELGGSKRTSIQGEKKAFGRPTDSSSARESVKKVPMRPIHSSSPKCSANLVSTVRLNPEKLYPTGVSRIKEQSDVGKAEYEQHSIHDVPEKVLHVIESNAEKETVTQNGDPATDLSTSLSSYPEHKSIKLAQSENCTALVSPTSAKISRQSQNGINAQRLPYSDRKQLRRARDGTHATQSSSISLASSRSCNDGGASSERCGAEITKGEVIKKPDYKSRPKRGGAISKKVRDSPARKVNFRAGKVVEIPSESATPGRLKFRRSLPHEGQVGKVDDKKPNLNGKDVDNGEINIPKTETNVPKTEAGKVILKHQEVEGKKIERSSLNNMIEATASKLEESSKSKVKILIGAFETVISLQDSKNLVTATAC